MKLEWSIPAITDREEIFDYIAAENPLAAVRFDERISECVKGLAELVPAAAYWHAII